MAYGFDRTGMTRAQINEKLVMYARLRAANLCTLCKARPRSGTTMTRCSPCTSEYNKAHYRPKIREKKKRDWDAYWRAKAAKYEGRCIRCRITIPNIYREKFDKNGRPIPRWAKIQYLCQDCYSWVWMEVAFRNKKRMFIEVGKLIHQYWVDKGIPQKYALFDPEKCRGARKKHGDAKVPKSAAPLGPQPPDDLS